MKTFLKVFGISFIIFVVLFGSIIFSFNRIMKDDYTGVDRTVIRAKEASDHFDKDRIGDIGDPLLRAFKESPRVNFVVMGLDGPRSDTLMFVSLNTETKAIDIISIPRDTYYPREGYNRADQKKINAAYSAHRGEGLKTVVSDLLFDVPVHHYIAVDYRGAAAIVDAIGGVPVYIPQLMKYDDPYDNPPLRIHFEPGHHVLRGADAVKFLRYRQPNLGSGAMDRHGDLGRIKAQQQFIAEAIRKSMSISNLPAVATNAFRHVRTDMELQEMIPQITNVMGLDLENLNMIMLPGEAKYFGGGAYFLHNPSETKALISQIYLGNTSDQTAEGEE